MVELVRAGRKPTQLAREFNVTAQSISTWVAQPAADSGKPARIKDVASSAGREELARLRRESPTQGQARHPRQDVHRVFELVNANQPGVSVRTLCRVLQVSASGYYAWRERPPSRRAIDNARADRAHPRRSAASNATYGMPRVRAELIDQGVGSAASA